MPTVRQWPSFLEAAMSHSMACFTSIYETGFCASHGRRATLTAVHSAVTGRPVEHYKFTLFSTQAAQSVFM